METIINTFATHRPEAVREFLEAAARRAKRHGVPAPTWSIKELRSETVRIPGTDMERQVLVHEVRVTGPYYQVRGWRMAAALDHLEGGNFFRVVPGWSVPIPPHYRETGPSLCEHCHTSRSRKKAYLLYHAGEARYIQVGSTCLKDFLGEANPEIFTWCGEFWGDLAGECGDPMDAGWGYTPGGGGEWTYDPILYGSTVCAVLRRTGWVSAREAQDKQRTSTAREALGVLERDLEYNLSKRTPEDKAELERREVIAREAEGYVDEARQAIAWARERDKGDMFQGNLVVLSFATYLRAKDLGTFAWILEGHRREVELNSARASQPRSNQHLGALGERRDFTLTLRKVRTHEGDFGPVHLHVFCDPEGNEVKWWSSRDLDFTVDTTVEVKATVKKHEVFDGRNVTVITRGKVLKVISKV